MIFHVLQAGLARVWALKKIWLLYYLTHLVLAGLAVFPARRIMLHYAGYSHMGGNLAQGMDFGLLLEFFHYRGDALSPVLLFAALLSLLFWLILLFFSGGTLRLVMAGSRYKARDFWGSCGRYFGRFLRYFLWTLPVLALLLMAPQLLNLLKKMIWGPDPREAVLYWLGWAKTGLRFLAILVWQLIFDYGRIRIVHSNDQKMSNTLLRTLRFAGKEFALVFSLTILLAAAGLLVLLLYNPAANLLNAPTPLALALLFLWQQLYMVFRAGLRLITLSSQARMYRYLQLE